MSEFVESSEMKRLEVALQKRAKRSFAMARSLRTGDGSPSQVMSHLHCSTEEPEALFRRGAKPAVAAQVMSHLGFMYGFAFQIWFQCLVCGVGGLFTIYGLGFGVWGLGFRVLGFGFRVSGL